jgi:hypothetical protein
VAATHKDAHKVTKDSINTLLHALSKQVALKKQGLISLLLMAVKEANPVEAKVHNKEKESKGESKGRARGRASRRWKKVRWWRAWRRRGM